MKRVLILGDIKCSFTDVLMRLGAEKGNIVFDDCYLLDFLPKAKVKALKLMVFFIRYMYSLILLVIKNKRYTCVHIHSFSSYYILFLPIIKLLSHKIVVTIYGSDIYYRDTPSYTKIDPKKVKYWAKKIFTAASAITFANHELAEVFNNYYHNCYQDKICVLRFGLVPLEIIKTLIEKESKLDVKRHFGIPADRVVVMCGTYAAKIQQHDQIIDGIKRLPNDVIKKCFFIFPLTYGEGREEIANFISNSLNVNKFSYKIMKQKVSDEDNARLRIVSDILIQILTGDALSGAMNETLYAGNIVITGAWLPYKVLEQLGVKFYRVKLASDIPELLCYIVKNYHIIDMGMDKENNKLLIWQLCSWEQNIKSWLDLYETRR